jgi:hypothetical protein
MITYSLTPKTIGWNLWLRWVGANILGIILAIVAEAVFWTPLGILMMTIIAWGFSSGYTSESLPTRIIALIMFFGVFPALAGALAWSIIGFFQNRVLQRYLPAMRRWTSASALGGAVAVMATLGPLIVAAEASAHRSDNQNMLVLLATVDLLIIGIVQWLVMRRTLPRSGWWVLANVASVLPGAALFVLDLISIDWVIASVGVLYPVLTGIVLVWLFRSSLTLKPATESRGA